MSDDLRNAEIVRRYLAPESICVIARDHGLTRQRIQQIVTLEGASRDHLYVIRRRQKALLEREKRAEAAARISAFFARVIELRATGLSWTNTAASLGVPYAHLLHRVDDFRARHPDQVGAFGPWTPRPERRKSRPLTRAAAV